MNVGELSRAGLATPWGIFWGYILRQCLLGGLGALWRFALFCRNRQPQRAVVVQSRPDLTFTRLHLCLELGHVGTAECLWFLDSGVISNLMAFKPVKCKSLLRPFPPSWPWSATLQRTIWFNSFAWFSKLKVPLKEHYCEVKSYGIERPL